MQSLLRKNKVEMPDASWYLQTNKAYSMGSSSLFSCVTAITVRDANSISRANREEIANIKSFIHLSDNWDGYEAAPISRDAMEQAISFIHDINKYDIDVYLSSPGPNGEVMIQLKLGRKEIEFIFYSNKSRYVLFSNNEFQSQAVYTPGLLPELVEWLVADATR